jgi:hypothetical protein
MGVFLGSMTYLQYPRVGFLWVFRKFHKLTERNPEDIYDGMVQE